MDEESVKLLVDAEIAKSKLFENFHGITKDNLKDFLVSPFQVEVDLDDNRGTICSMWVFLQSPDYDLVFDPESHSWGVAEKHLDNQYILICSANSLVEALSSM